jgi:hypothetical protein
VIDQDLGMGGTGASSSEIGLNTVAPGGDAVTPEVDEMFSTIDALGKSWG